MDPLGTRSKMNGSRVGNLVAVMDVCGMEDGIIVSPCKRCKHLKEKLDKTICVKKYKCILHVEREPVSSMRSGSTATKNTINKICAFPGCNLPTKIIDNDYCPKHGKAVNRRASWWKSVNGGEPTIEWLHRPFNERHVKDKQCKFPGCKNKTTRFCDVCLRHQKIISDRRVKWKRKHKTECPEEVLYMPVQKAGKNKLTMEAYYERIRKNKRT